MTTMTTATTTPLDPPLEPAPRNPRWLALTNQPLAPVVLILVATTLRLLWLALVSDYTLIEDEAHYWDWSRYLDWSYYSKGPGVAWAIAISTALFDHSEFAVRLPAAIAAAIGALAAADAARTIARSSEASAPREHNAAFIAAVLYLVAPSLAVLGTLMTIDGPYLAAWTVATAAALRAATQPKPTLTTLALIGSAIAIGFLFKYTILTLLPGLFWILLRHRPRPLPLATLLATMLLGLIPVAIWNAQNDYATVRHLLGHLGAPGGDITTTHDDPTPLLQRLVWPLEYIAFTAFIAGPIPIIVLLAARAKRITIPPAAKDSYRIAAPAFLFYLVVSFITQIEGNWALAAPVTLIPASAVLIVQGVRQDTSTVRFCWGATLIAGIATWIALPVAPLIAGLPGMGFIPEQRFTGLKEHAAAVQAELDRLEQQTGLLPFVITNHYGRASQLAFYLDGQPTVYTAMHQTGGRKSQYDIWPHTSLSDLNTQTTLTGRPAVALGGELHTWLPAFEFVAPLGRLAADPKSNRQSYLAFGYRTFQGWVPHSQREDWTGPNTPPESAGLRPPRTPIISTPAEEH